MEQFSLLNNKKDVHLLTDIMKQFRDKSLKII